MSYLIAWFALIIGVWIIGFPKFFSRFSLGGRFSRPPNAVVTVSLGAKRRSIREIMGDRKANIFLRLIGSLLVLVGFSQLSGSIAFEKDFLGMHTSWANIISSWQSVSLSILILVFFVALIVVYFRMSNNPSFDK